ncbi:bestrophin-like domain [Labrys neptuniae]
MEEIYGLGFLLLFSLSAIGGVVLRGRLHEEHLSKENIEAVRLVTGLLVTFSALILSLQLSTARADFEAASKDRTTDAAQLANLDQCLRDLSPQMAAARALLRRYTAAVIISSWPSEPAPQVKTLLDTKDMPLRGEDAALAGLMNQIGLAIDRFEPGDAAGRNILVRCQFDYRAVRTARWAVIEDTHAPAGVSLTLIIGFWLALVFLSFGLQIPRRLLSVVVLALGVVCVSSVMFVIVDLKTPYGGIFSISSASMRDALTDMNRD